jgi:hypothetical protein
MRTALTTTSKPRAVRQANGDVLAAAESESGGTCVCKLRAPIDCYAPVQTFQDRRRAGQLVERDGPGIGGTNLPGWRFENALGTLLTPSTLAGATSTRAARAALFS